MERKEIITKLKELNIKFSKKSNTKVLQNKLENNVLAKGIKAFRLLENGDLQTGGIGGSKFTTFKEGKTYEVSHKRQIELCSHGFHFYRQKDACFGIKLFNEDTVFHEIIVYGNVIKDTEKCVARKIKIGKRINIDLNISGNYNSGDYNSGNRNSGDCNSRNYNSGYRNSGNRNSGDYNSGNYNSGYRNSGNRNSGNRNSGDYNSGDCNSGDYNSGYHNSGNYNSGNYNSGDCNSGYRNSGNYNSGDRNSGNRNSGDYNSGDGYFNYFCTETKYFLFDTEVSKEIIDLINNFKTNWFNLKDKSYKEAWAECPIEFLDLVREIPEFKTKIAKRKFKEITGIDL